MTRLVRHAPAPGVPQVRWDTAAGTIDAKGLAGIEAAIHLAGEGIADRRWTPAQKRRIRDSRTGGTRLLSETLAALDPRPKTLVCASAKDYYGDRGEERLDEEAPRGADFLSLAVDEWEKAADPAVQAGIRVVKFRFGMVLGRSGGGLAKMLLPFRLGLGGRMGSGKPVLELGGPGRPAESHRPLADQPGAIRAREPRRPGGRHQRRVHTDSRPRPVPPRGPSSPRLRPTRALRGSSRHAAGQRSSGPDEASELGLCVRVPGVEGGAESRPQSVLVRPD